MMERTMRGRDFLSPAKQSTAGSLALRREEFTASRASQAEDSPSRTGFQFTAFGRGMGRTNAPNRRKRPVTIRLAKAETIPPSNAGRRDQIENIVKESSPFSASLHATCNHPAYPLQAVAPVRPVAPYIGGKRNLAKRVITRINDVPHDTYAEVFVGMGGIFLRRDLRPAAEVINDWSEDVSTFFRILQHHYVAFLDMIRFQIASRAGFEKLLATDPRSLTDLQRAARFLYLQRLAFGGKVDSRTFGVAPTRPSRFDVTKLAPMLEALHERLAGVTIERLRWQDFVARYDRPGTLFYLDPPYFDCEGDYGAGMFGQAEFAEMAEQLARLKGQFMLSLNDHPTVRELFGRFTLEEVQTTYQVSGNGKAQPARELIITGPAR
ncbi:DNA adenine methylase [Sphingobium sp. IP1]|uniref:DNA adenine methylase n=1 Tax=Sphingobium sp. IP1 TaxID=2021637 RepID=UPI0027BABE6C|nr:DNA adenine methylase [Sphingobium sp. IP1]